MFRDPFPILLTDDLPRLLGFYRDELGFTESFRFPDGPGEPEFAVLALGPAQLGFGKAGTPSLHGQPRASGTGNRVEVCVYVDDGPSVDRAVQRLRAAGAPLLAEPADQPWGERAAYVADPDGTPILIVGPLEPAAAPGTGPEDQVYAIDPIGVVRSPLTDPATAPKQGDEGAPEAWLEFDGRFRTGLRDLRPGGQAIVLTWLDRARRDVLTVHPRGDTSRPETGVFSTRSPHRPNPVGLHRVGVLAVDLDADHPRVRVRDLEALDGTPVVDVKPVLGDVADR
jgi:tRNA-Thr(GGU) m(6)t(6)A37 methyltransferase TsaA